MISTPVLAIGIPGLSGIGIGELALILVIVLVLFGPKRLPQLGKSIGKTMKAIRDGADGKLGEAEEDEDSAAAPAKKSEAKVEAKTKAKTEAKSNDDEEA